MMPNPAGFSIDPGGRQVTAAGFAYYPNRVLFRFGDYPDHGISVSPEEGVAAVARFRGPLGGNIEHTEFLAGQANFVDAIRIDESDPTLLRGDVRIPLWLDEQIGDHEKKVSAEWCKATKDFRGVALCVHPAIPEADLLARFKKHSSAHGKRTMQVIHDTAAASGAYCVDPQSQGDTSVANAAFILRHERGTLQKIHDHAVESGAACHGSSAYFRSQAPPPAKGKPMSLFGKILKAFAPVATDEELDDLTAKFAAPPAEAREILKAFEPKPEAKVETKVETADFRKDPEFIRTQKENAEFRARLLAADAESWAEGEVRANRALAAEKPRMVALFAQACLDDRSDHGVATFSEASKALGADRVALLKATYAARPAHRLFEEFLQDPKGDDAALFTLPSLAASAKGKADPKEVDELRGYTTLLPRKAN